MNIYVAVGVTGFCINLVYHSWRCKVERKWIENQKRYDEDRIGFWRSNHNLNSYNPDSYNARNGTNLTSRQIRQIYSEKIETAEKASEYYQDIYRQNANRHLYYSHPFSLVIMVCKFLRKERFFTINRDKNRELDFIAKIRAPLTKKATITHES